MAEGVSGVHTSVPRRPRSAPGVDPAGRTYAVLAFGPAARAMAQRWEQEIDRLGRPVWARHAPAATDEVLGELHAQLAAATVGWRLMVAGPEHDVLVVRAQARSGGALDSEIVGVVTTDGHRRVWCPHCGATTGADVEIGGVVPCAGCGAALLVYHHVSRHTASYLGYRVDAEEMP